MRSRLDRQTIRDRISEGTMYVTITVLLGDIALLVDEWQRHHNLLERGGEEKCILELQYRNRPISLTLIRLRLRVHCQAATTRLIMQSSSIIITCHANIGPLDFGSPRWNQGITIARPIRSPESSINLDPDFFFFFFFFLYSSFLSWNKVKKGEVTTSMWICVKAKVKMIDRLGIDVKLWLNISFNFQQMLLSIFCLNINLACILELLCIFFSIRGISCLCSVVVEVRRVFLLLFWLKYV